MPDIASPINPPFDHAVALARKLSDAQGPSSFVLPALQNAEPKQGLIEELIKTLTDLVLKFLKAIIPQSDSAPTFDLAAIAKGVTWLAGIAIAVALLVLLYELSKYFGLGSKAALGPVLKSEAPSENELLKLLAQALEQKSYARAARLRWRICLERLGEPQSLTPRELGDRRALSARLEPSAYGLMFRGGTPDARAFEEWDDALVGIERGPAR